MTKNCIETIDLTHKFSEDETALDRVNLEVTEGSIDGFRTPNGAGKTTPKLILGLLKKQHRAVLLYPEKHLLEIADNEGIYKVKLTVYEN